MHVPRVVRSAVLLCFVLRAASVLAASEKPLDPLVQASNRFGAKLLAEIHRQHPQENVFISPASIALALGVAWSGARGETRAEMGRCLEIERLGLGPEHAGTAGLLRSIHRTDPGIELEIATSLWVGPGETLRSDFVERTAKAYEAQVEQLETGDTAARINAWVREKTHGKIDSIVDKLPPALVVEILNAVYFHGTWAEEFDEKETREKPFHLLDGGVEPLSMMARYGTYPYFEGTGFRAAALAYLGDMMHLCVVLPDSQSGLGVVIASLASDTEWGWAQQLEPRSGEVVLPRFTLTYDLTMNEVLKKMGMERAFDPGRADFSGIVAGDMWINRVRHKSWVEVNERGTEAAAVTVVEGVASSDVSHVARNPFRLVVDRPFLCVVRDRMTGLVLFLGVVTHPQRL